MLVEKIVSHQTNKTIERRNFLLLAEKAYWLIKQKRMKDVNMQMLSERIEQLSADKEFNLYKFIEEFRLHPRLSFFAFPPAVANIASNWQTGLALNKEYRHFKPFTLFFS